MCHVYQVKITVKDTENTILKLLSFQFQAKCPANYPHSQKQRGTRVYIITIQLPVIGPNNCYY